MARLHQRSTLSLATFAAAVALSPATGIGQQVTRDTVPAQRPARAAVVVRGDTLFELTGTIGPFTPAERARALARRVDSLANDSLAKAADLVLVDSAGVTDIRLGNFVIMAVTTGDALEAGQGRAELGAQWAARIQRTIRERESRASIVGILIGFLKTLLVTGLLVLAFMAMNRAFPTAYRLLEKWRGTRIPAIKIQRLEVLSASRVTDILVGATKVLRIVAIVVLLYVYLPLVFSFFPWTQNLADKLFSWVVDPLSRAWIGFINYLPDLFAIAVIAAVVYYLLKFIHLAFMGIERGAISLPGFYRDWSEPTYKIVRFVVIAFAAIMIWPYLPGSDSDAFKGISVFLGVLISFGSASAIANVVAGVVMTYMRPFQLGDRVKIADTMGDVIDRTLLITRVRTPKQVDVTIPNAMVLSSHIINYSRTATQGGVILHTGVTIGYDAPWRQVHDLLLAAADATEGVLKEPNPFVLQTSLDDFYVNYELNAYTDNPNAMSGTYSELHKNIQDKFNEAGVEIMSPHYGAMRDGNQTTIPSNYLPKGYEAPAFKIRTVADMMNKVGSAGWKGSATGPDPRD